MLEYIVTGILVAAGGIVVVAFLALIALGNGMKR